ncbi:YgjP-like metallopeptidase domain-containing protein [Mycoplasmopsis gallinacea]|uniref:DUF45 domain-containing protein n=1 Tax=Mycoplasmopsis gallinacea TaxID=29556 RepID=A0A6H0V3D1_9BACT|nr:YgjP-like metallopeptidase domain-containing protein [Mycoplasmopsis gallinacea]QIW62199.1 DUF45 domain-containing protein [Mycoplasmopsis gallinacea]
MKEIVYQYKGINFVIYPLISAEQRKIEIFPENNFWDKQDMKPKDINIKLSLSEYLQLEKAEKIENWYFKPQLDKYLDYHIKHNLDISGIKNEWISNPGQICFLGKKHILKWEFKDEITNPLEYKFEISSAQITLFVSRILEKRVIKRRVVLMNFLKEQLAEVIKKIQPKYEDKLSLKPVDFEIYELLPQSKSNTIASAWYLKNLIQYTISMICSDLDLIEHTILHELLHHIHKDKGHSAKFYKDGEKFIEDFKLLHKFVIAPNTFYKKF